jgi:hypothetical protein
MEEREGEKQKDSRNRSEIKKMEVIWKRNWCKEKG